MAASEADLIIPDLSSQSFLGTDGHTLLLGGLVVCVLGLLFGIVTYQDNDSEELDIEPSTTSGLRDLVEVQRLPGILFLRRHPGEHLLLVGPHDGAAVGGRERAGADTAQGAGQDDPFPLHFVDECRQLREGTVQPGLGQGPAERSQPLS